MPIVDRNSEMVIIEFCRKFNANLQKIEDKANTLRSLGGRIESALYNTQFATNASGTVSDTAEKILTAVQQGEQWIGQILARAERPLMEEQQFERPF